MEIAKKLAEKARASGAVRESSQFFSVTETRQVDAGGGEMVTVTVPNGLHKVKILAEKLGTGKSFNGKDQNEIQLEILDNGKPMQWNVPVKNEDGTLYYLIEDLENIAIGEEFYVEAVKMKNGKYAKRISKGAGKVAGGEVPTIQLNDDNAGEDAAPKLDEGEDISPEDIPF